MADLVFVVLFAIQLGTSLGCSCYPGSLQRFKCKKDVHNIFSAEIKYIKSEEEPTQGWMYGYAGYGAAGNPWNNGRQVTANVTRVFKGDGVAVGDSVEISSMMMGSMCGVGSSLNPGRTFYLSSGARVPDVFRINMCDTLYLAGMDRSNDHLEWILENHDCECDVWRCKLTEGKHVFRGFCGDDNAWCERDEEDVCRWIGASSIRSCKQYSQWDW